jgi:hypothetical protein
MKSHTGQFGIMHNKFLIVDQSNIASDPLVLTGSHNWSTSANDQNDENILIIHDDTIANQYLQAFSYLFSEDGGVMAVAENKFENESFIFPNPFTDFLHVTAKNKSEMVIYNVLGEIAGSWELTSGNNEIKPELTASGIYFCFIKDAEGICYRKIMRQ